MNAHNPCSLESSRKTAGLRPQFLVGTIGLGMVLAGLPAQASDSQTLWECSSYTGAAHTRCMEAFVESQREQIAELQGKLKAQQETVDHLKDQVDHQASASADLQRQLAQPPAVVQVAPPLYTYPYYAYPPVGLGLYLGRPWIYGPPYLYRPYIYGPRHYGPRHRGHRW